MLPILQVRTSLIFTLRLAVNVKREGCAIHSHGRGSLLRRLEGGHQWVVHTHNSTRPVEKD